MEPGQIVAGRFAIETVAGSGGMGVVYRALDLVTAKLVALKVLRGHAEGGDPEVARFDREARLLSELAHPAIVAYVAHGFAASGEPFLAMEWLEGESLSDRLRRAPLSLGESLALGKDVASALGEAHARGIVHRDVKPANLHLIGGQPEGGARSFERVKVLDFGIARLAKDEQALTATGLMIGTPGYMAPEQARGDRTVDARVDVFSLGCVLFRCLAGRPAFEGEDAMAILLKVVLEQPTRLAELCRGVPAALDTLVMRALSKDRDARYADGREVAAELCRIEEEGLEATAQQPAIDAGGAPGRDSLGRPVDGDAATIAGRGRATVQVPTSLTRAERRVMCLVVARPRAAPPAVAASAEVDAETASPTRATTAHIGEAIARVGGQLETLADGALLVTVAPVGAATDQAARAARAALALGRMLPGGAVALVAGRAATHGGVRVGEVVDRGVALLGLGDHGVRIDADAAALVEVGFRVERDAHGLRLAGEHDVAGHARQLLGRPTPCVGRDRELALLEAMYEEAASESAARVALVTGAPGVGKSRLRHELIERLGRREAPPQVWIARADSMSGGSPFGLLGPMIRRTCGVHDGERDAEIARARLTARIAERVDAADVDRVARFVGELAGVPFPDDGDLALATARKDPRVMGDQMRNAFEDWVRAEAASPLVVVLEDLHWGDLPSVAFVGALLERIEDRPLLVVGLARPSVHDTFPKLWAERGVQEVRLGPLTRRASEELARAVLGDRVADATSTGGVRVANASSTWADRATPERIARVVELAAGNAFYLEEILRAVAEGADELPSTVLAMVEARIDALAPDARRALRAASIFGAAAWPSAVAALTGNADVAATGAILADLARRELLSPRRQSRFPGEEEFGFRHAIVRDAAYATLTDDDRALGHRMAGAWLEGAGEQDGVVLGDHFDQGGDAERATEHYLRAATKALEGSDLRATVTLTRRAARGAQGEARGRLLAIEADASAWLGELDVAERLGADAMAALRPGSAAWYSALGAVVLAVGGRNDTDAILRALSPVCELIPEDDALVSYSNLMVVGSARLTSAGLRGLGDRLLAHVEATRDRVSHPIVATACLSIAGFRAMLEGDPYRCLSMSKSAQKTLLTLGHRRYATTAISAAAISLNELGAYAEAEAEFAKATEIANSIGMIGFMPVIEHNRGLTLLRLGRLDEALALEREALAHAEALTPRLVRPCHTYLAKIHCARGEIEAAAREAEEATSMGSAGHPALAHALATRAVIELARGQAEAALASAREAQRILDDLPAMYEAESVVRLALVDALVATGRGDEAKAALARATARLMERAAGIADPALVRTFLEAVPENARTIALSASTTSGRPS